MGNLDYKEFTRRRRPQYNPVDGTLFLTFRLAGAVPKSVVRHYRAKLHWLRDQSERIQRLAADDRRQRFMEWQEEIDEMQREWFLKTENILHRANHGPTWMADAKK